MRQSLLLTLLFVAASSLAVGQIKLNEGFESADSANLPTGWSKWNRAPFTIEPESHWLVQDTGREIIGINVARLTVARSGGKSVRVSWVAGSDSASGALGTSDAWLVTRRIPNIEANDSLVFWAIGGNGGTTGTYYYDSLQVWIDTQDSLPVNITFPLDTITWDNTNSVYGVFKRYAYHVGIAAGNDLFVGFRYNQSVLVDGYVVFVDDVMIKGPLTSVSSRTGLPTELSLEQNYPNPFNPNTTIAWGVPASSRVIIRIFNLIGQEVGVLVDADMEPGFYKTTWNATGFPSGTYFYQLQVGSSLQTRKMVFLR